MRRICLSETEQIQGILNGEPTYFHELVGPYERRAFLIAYAILRTHEDAEDAVQQAMMKIFQHLGELADAAKFPQWAMRTVANEAKMYRRKRHRHLYRSLDGDPEEYRELEQFHPREFADWRDLPIDAVERGEVRAAVNDALCGLPEIYREIFVLGDMEHLSMAEIAAVLDISIPAVKTRLHRARLMMREMLSPLFARPKISAWERWKGGALWFGARR